MPADFTISQAGGAGTGVLNTELLAVWGGLVVQLAAAAAAAYSWEILDRPHGAVATIVSPTAQNATLTPDDLPGRWRIQLTTPDGTRVVVFEVTRTVAGVVYNFGLGVTPAHLERPSEAGGRGAARVFERFRASLLSLIASLPLADKLLLRDGTGQALATAFVGPAAAVARVASQGTQNVHIDSANDVLIDVAAEGDVVRVQVNGADAMTVTPTAGKVAVELPNRTLDLNTKGGANGIEVNSGRDATIDHATGRSTLLKESGSTYAEFRATGTTIAGTNAGLDISAGAVGSDEARLWSTSGTTIDGGTGAVLFTTGATTATCSDSSGTFLCSTNAPMRIQPSSVGVVGAGRALTIGGGAGQTPGTHLAGKTIVDLGAPVANVTEEFEVRRGDGTKLLGTKQFANGFVWLDFGTSFGDIRSNTTVALRGPTSVQYVSPTLQRFDPSGANYRDESSRLSPSTINTATTTNVGAGVTISNVDSTEIVECTLGWWNKTDSTAGWRKFRRAFKRVGGTVTAIGSLVEDDAGSYVEAGETGVTCDFTISGTTVIPRITTPDTDERRAFAYVEQTKRLTW